MFLFSELMGQKLTRTGREAGIRPEVSGVTEDWSHQDVWPGNGDGALFSVLSAGGLSGSRAQYCVEAQGSRWGGLDTKTKWA